MIVKKCYLKFKITIRNSGNFNTALPASTKIEIIPAIPFITRGIF